MGTLATQFRHLLMPLVGRRIVAVDLGSRCLKLLVVEALPASLRVVHRQTVDTQEEGLLTPEELHQHLEMILPKFGPHALVVVLPQQKVMAQAIDLPAAGSMEAGRLLEEEAVKLSGLTESTMVYGFARLKPFGKCQNPYSLTLCQSSEVWDEVNRLLNPAKDAPRGAAAEQIWEITTSAEGLVSASQVIRPRIQDAVLVDLGAQNTVVALMVRGQGVLATSFPLGSNHFTEALARLQSCSIEEAETRKRSETLFAGERALPAMGDIVREWHREVSRAVTEWLDENPEVPVGKGGLTAYLSGGGACQAGLFEFLNSMGGLTFKAWPPGLPEEPNWPMEQYWVAYGAALQALGKAPRAVSLLPAALRAVRTRQRLLQATEAINVTLLLALTLLLGFGTWQKMRLLREKTHLRSRTEAALQTAQTIDLLSRRLNVEYEQVRPVLQRQRQSLEALQALTAVQQVRSNKDFWYVLFADALSYGAGTTLPMSITNATNGALALLTNPPSRREFVAELCIPQEGDEARRILSQVVTDLKNNPFFARVDALPSERRKNLVDARVLLTNRHFAVSMELAALETMASPAGADQPAVILPARETRRLFQGIRSRSNNAVVPGAKTNR